MGNEDSSGETVENANGSREETTTRGGLGGTQYKLLLHLACRHGPVMLHISAN